MLVPPAIVSVSVFESATAVPESDATFENAFWFSSPELGSPV